MLILRLSADLVLFADDIIESDWNDSLISPPIDHLGFLLIDFSRNVQLLFPVELARNFPVANYYFVVLCFRNSLLSSLLSCVTVSRSWGVQLSF